MAECRQGCLRPQRNLEDRQAPLDQGPSERHGVGRPLDRQQRHDRRQRGDGRNIHRQTLQPPSITFTVPVVKADSSLARYSARAAISSADPKRPVG
jgi:hypothetical protein